MHTRILIKFVAPLLKLGWTFQFIDYISFSRVTSGTDKTHFRFYDVLLFRAFFFIHCTFGFRKLFVVSRTCQSSTFNWKTVEKRCILLNIYQIQYKRQAHSKIRIWNSFYERIRDQFQAGTWPTRVQVLSFCQVPSKSGLEQHSLKWLGGTEVTRNTFNSR